MNSFGEEPKKVTNSVKQGSVIETIVEEG